MSFFSYKSALSALFKPQSNSFSVLTYLANKDDSDSDFVVPSFLRHQPPLVYICMSMICEQLATVVKKNNQSVCCKTTTFSWFSLLLITLCTLRFILWPLIGGPEPQVRNQGWQTMRWHHRQNHLINSAQINNKQMCFLSFRPYSDSNANMPGSVFSATWNLNTAAAKECFQLSQTTLLGPQYQPISQLRSHTIHDNRLTVSIWSQWTSMVHVYVFWDGFCDGCNSLIYRYLYKRLTQTN